MSESTSEESKCRVRVMFLIILQDKGYACRVSHLLLDLGLVDSDGSRAATVGTEIG